MKYRYNKVVHMTVDDKTRKYIENLTLARILLDI